MTATIVRCDTCNSLVELARKENGTLTLVCDCPEQLAIKTIKAIPEGWQA